MAVDHTLEELMGMLGDFGRYQGFQFFLHILAALTAGLHMLSLVTVSAEPDHRCFIPGHDTNISTLPWDSPFLKEAIPLNKKGQLDQCLMFDFKTNESIPCTSGYVYSEEYYGYTKRVEWGFVCDRKYMGALAQTVYMFGVFTGAVVLGGLADKVGRKTVFCWSAILQLILGVGVAFIPEYYSFLVIRFIYGIFGSAGSYITGFVLTMELVGPSYRTACGVAFQAAFAAGIMLVAGWGALIKDVMLLQAVYGLHGCLLIAHWWVMDESPRWLWMQGRTEEAVNVVAKAVKMNKRGVSVDKEYFIGKGKAAVRMSEESTSVGIADLFKTPNLRVKTINVCFCWFANSLVYYGLSLSAGNLEGNPFLMLFISGLVEYPSYAAIIVLLDRLGRRSITSFLMLIGGICCIVAAYCTGSASIGIVMAGKLCIAGSFAVIYNYSAELFPTVVRNSAMGLGSMAARLSGAMTPLITLLDSLDPRIPAVLFGVVALVSGLWVLFLPETMDQPMPQSIADGERFGKGDTFFTTFLGRKKTHAIDDPMPEQMVPLETIGK